MSFKKKECLQKFTKSAALALALGVATFSTLSVAPSIAHADMAYVTVTEMNVLPGDHEAIGDEVTYEIILENSADAVSEFRINHAAFSGEMLGFIRDSCDLLTEGTVIESNETLTCELTYALQEADFVNEALDLTLGFSYEIPDADPQTIAPVAFDSVPLVQNADLEIFASTNVGTAPVRVGDELIFTLAFQNTGNLNLTGEFEFLDFNGVGTLSPIDCDGEFDAIAAGEILTCTYTYTVVEGDLGATLALNGIFTGESVAGALPVETDVPTFDLSVVEAALAPAFEVTTFDNPSAAPTKPGDVIDYRMIIAGGEEELTDFKFDLMNFTGVASDIVDDTCGLFADGTIIEANADTECTFSYTVKETDILNGGVGLISNFSYVLGAETVSSDEFVINEIEITPNGQVEVTTSIFGPVQTRVGDTVEFRLSIQNVGNLSLTEMVLADLVFNGSTGVPAYTCDDTTIAIDGAVNCVFSYVVTPEDLGKTLSLTGNVAGLLADGSEGGFEFSIADNSVVQATSNTNNGGSQTQNQGTSTASVNVIPTSVDMTSKNMLPAALAGTALAGFGLMAVGFAMRGRRLEQ